MDSPSCSGAGVPRLPCECTGALRCTRVAARIDSNASILTTRRSRRASRCRRALREGPQTLCAEPARTTTRSMGRSGGISLRVALGRRGMQDSSAAIDTVMRTLVLTRLYGDALPYSGVQGQTEHLIGYRNPVVLSSHRTLHRTREECARDLCSTLSLRKAGEFKRPPPVYRPIILRQQFLKLFYVRHCV